LLLQIVADAESCSPAIEKEKRPRIVALRMSCDPFRNLAAEIWRYGHRTVALIRLRIANAILSQLPFLQRFIDAKLVAFKVVDAQRESLTRPQATHSKNSQHEVLPWRSRRQEGLHLLDAEKPLARLFVDVWQCEFPRGVLGNQIFVNRVFKTSFQIRANMFDRGFRVPILRHLVHQQLKRSQCDFAGRILAEDWKHVLVEQVLHVFSHLFAPGPRLHR